MVTRVEHWPPSGLGCLPKQKHPSPQQNGIVRSWWKTGIVKTFIFSHSSLGGGGWSGEDEKIRNSIRENIRNSLSFSWFPSFFLVKHEWTVWGGFNQLLLSWQLQQPMVEARLEHREKQLWSLFFLGRKRKAYHTFSTYVFMCWLTSPNCLQGDISFLQKASDARILLESPKGWHLSFNKYFLSGCYMTDTALGTEKTALNTDQTPTLSELIF